MFREEFAEEPAAVEGKKKRNSLSTSQLNKKLNQHIPEN
jgi:hypothetical protein